MGLHSDESGCEVNLLELTTSIVSSHVSNNQVDTSDLPGLIDSIYEKLNDLSTRQVRMQALPRPAVSVAESVTGDYLICLEDGKRFKMLKKHLMVHYGMTPEDYRARWNLPADYPMVAPNYAAKRQRLALESGLGKNRK